MTDYESIHQKLLKIPTPRERLLGGIVTSVKEKGAMERVVIFGATSAIAVGAAREWAARGAAIYLVARSTERLDALSRDLTVRGASEVKFAQFDCADYRRHGVLVSEIEREFTFDTVLIAYGVLGNQEASQRDFSLAVADLEVNLISVMSLVTEIANRFEERRSGHIAVITSVAGDRGRKSNYFYGTAKGALGIFLQGVRNRLYRSGVQVLTIKPGFVATPMTAHLKRGPLFAEPDSVGRGIVKAIARGRDVVYLPWFWLVIMRIIQHIPEFIFKRMSI